METYSGFKVLLDDPAEIPGLGFRNYASALAEIVVDSRAEFAVGVFGSWGSGKTTLMRAIERNLAGDANIVTVWFTAWRYERESHLIVPLLDVLREELDRRATAQDGPHTPARRAAAAIARAGRAFLAGLTFSAQLPGVEARWEADKIIAALRAENDDGSQSLSFYHAGFVMLREAIQEFSADGTRRVVVFVDDLDRCLPSSALDLLESMKLFFDVEGVVFVVGLDQTIVERAVALKYGSESNDSTDVLPVSGSDYVKKIFQVPFTLPRISTDQLQEYLGTVASNADLAHAQQDDFDQNVRRHLQFPPGEDSVNPREVKRLINTYVLQLKMLSPRLREHLDPNIVLALQCLSFRPDWRDLYDHLAADPRLFQSALREAVEAEVAPDAIWLSGVRVVLPRQFLQYVQGHAHPLLQVPDIQFYVSAAESTHSTDPSLLEAQIMSSRLRKTTEDLSSEDLFSDAMMRLPSELHSLLSLASRNSKNRQLERIIKELDILGRELANAESTSELGSGRDLVSRITTKLDIFDDHLRELRRQTNVGAFYG